MVPRPYSGTWASKYIAPTNLQPYATAAVWGTGISPIHSIYGEGPPIRVLGRPGEEGSAGYEGQPAGDSVPQQWIATDMWGYRSSDDRTNNYVDYDDRPNWGEQPPQYRGDIDDHPSVGESAESFREQHGGAHRFRQKLADALPNETVTEGWRNKPKGRAADAEPSADSQLIVQTSMRQRYQTRNNDHAVARATDDPREVIHSRVVGQKLKIYSGEERHEDMFPYQQEIILRPFWYRSAGTGDPAMMEPNEMFQSTPVIRQPPPDPSMGINEEESGYGYTTEDPGYNYG